MKLIEGYIFRKMGGSFVLTLVVLSATVWLSQALRQFDLVANLGQTLATFFQVTLLLLPALTMLVCPVAILIAVSYTFRLLNDGSELAVINASGARQSILLKPVLYVGAIAAIFMWAMTLYFSPLSLQAWRELLTNVRSNVVSSVIREGQFLKIGPDLAFHLAHRRSNGTLEGIFLSDTRDPQVTTTYLAQRGALIDNPLGVFLAMNDGTIQRRNNANGAISMVEFSSYAFDLSTLAAQASLPDYNPNERSTAYLLNPDRNDRLYRRFPGKYRAELTFRLTAPLNALLFAVLPLVFLGQAETTRQQRSVTTALGVGATVSLGVAEYIISGMQDESMLAVVAGFAIPLAAIGISVALVLTGRQPKPPERLMTLLDAVGGRMSGLVRRAARPVPQQSG